MTRLAILADIHGNLPALEAVIADLDPAPPDHVIAAGDLINVGPFSAQVMARASELGWAAIRGNHEHYLLEYNTPRAPASRRNWITTPLLYAQLAGRWYNTIAALPDQLTLYYPDAPPIRVVHGLPGDPFRSLDRLTSIEEARALLAGIAEQVVISGHYHLSFDRRIDGWRVLNPGSLGVPLDGCQDAHYLLLESHNGDWQATFRRVPVDYAPLYAEFARQRFVEQTGVIGHLIVEQFRHARPIIVAYDRWRRDHAPDTEWSIPQVDAFLTSDNWHSYIPAVYQYNL
jgi:predicted phosphodiesterase